MADPRNSPSYRPPMPSGFRWVDAEVGEDSRPMMISIFFEQMEVIRIRAMGGAWAVTTMLAREDAAPTTTLTMNQSRASSFAARWASSHRHLVSRVASRSAEVLRSE